MCDRRSDGKAQPCNLPTSGLVNAPMQLDLRPALGTTTQWGRAHDARAMLVGDDPHAWLHLDDDEVAVVRLMTGRHTVAELHTHALALDQSVVPDRVNDLLRRLERARLLATEVDASNGLYSAVRATSARRSAWTVSVGARMQRLLSLVPSALVRPLTTLIAMGLARLVLFAFARGQAGALFRRGAPTLRLRRRHWGGGSAPASRCRCEASRGRLRWPPMAIR